MPAVSLALFAVFIFGASEPLFATFADQCARVFELPKKNGETFDSADLIDASLDLGLSATDFARTMNDENSMPAVRAIAIAHLETRRLSKEFWLRIGHKLLEPKYSLTSKSTFMIYVGWFFSSRQAPSSKNPLSYARGLLVTDVLKEMAVQLSSESQMVLTEFLSSFPVVERFSGHSEEAAERLTRSFVRDYVDKNIRRQWLRRSYENGTLKVNVNEREIPPNLAPLVVKRALESQVTVDKVFTDLYRNIMDNFFKKNPTATAFFASLSSREAVLRAVNERILPGFRSSLEDLTLANSVSDYFKYILDPEREKKPGAAIRRVSLANEFMSFLVRAAKANLKASKPFEQKKPSSKVENTLTVQPAVAPQPMLPELRRFRSRSPKHNTDVSPGSNEKGSAAVSSAFKLDDLSPQDKIAMAEKACLTPRVFENLSRLLGDLEPASARIALDSIAMLAAGVSFRDVPHVKSLFFKSLYEIKLSPSPHRIYFTVGPAGFKVLEIGYNIKNSRRREDRLIFQVSQTAAAFHK
jgi:hypothetical protein